MPLERTLLPSARLVIDEWAKMAFVAGPRQVGKTTLAKTLLASRTGLYFNWDIPGERKRLAANPTFFETAQAAPGLGKPLIVFDELHKYSRWKNYLKGVFDGFADRFAFLVTGSGRLDIYKRGGDSLLGRYVPLTLFPLTLAEVAGLSPTWPGSFAHLDAVDPENASHQEVLERLLRFGGFPEPYVRGSEAFHNAWGTSRTERLVHEDIRDATSLRELSLVEMLAHLLPQRVGSPLSINSMREDLGVAFETVRSWVGVLDAFFYSFRIPPWTKKVVRAIGKETKLYLWDWSSLDDPGSRFENLVAVHLLKAVRTWTSLGQAHLALHYVRDKQKREVDFLITEKNKPKLLIECKLSDTSLSPHLLAFQEALEVPVAVQLVSTPGYARRTVVGGRVQWCVSADRWLPKLL